MEVAMYEKRRLRWAGGMVKPWKFIPGKSKGEMEMPGTNFCKITIVMTLAAQVKSPRVIRLMGRRRSLIMGRMILFRKYQTTAARAKISRLLETEKPG